MNDPRNEIMADGLPRNYITVTSGMSGYFAVEIWFAPEMGGFREPWQTGIGRYNKYSDAVAEAKNWAKSEGLKYYVETI